MVHYTYDGSFLGFLSVVFEIYSTKQLPSDISVDGEYQTDFFSDIVFIPTDEDKALRVERRLITKLGYDGFLRLVSAFCCGFEPEKKDMKIFNFVRLAMKEGKAACEMYYLYIVSDFNTLVLKTEKEIHNMQGFLRFRVLSNGILLAEYTPDNDITQFLTPYFSQRNAEDRFIIRDLAREVYGLYNGSEWAMIEGNETLAKMLDDIAYSEEELVFRDLWQQYYDTVAIASRRNERQRAQFMPRRYWRYLTEFVT